MGPVVLLLLGIIIASSSSCTASSSWDHAEERAQVVEPPLAVGSFNVQNLGNDKLKDDKVTDVLVQIILRYDLILIMEIVTKQPEMFQGLVDKVNQKASKGAVYALEISPRLGRGTAKEQYGYIYRSDRVSASLAQVYPDEEDVFERPPWIVQFNTPPAKDINKFLVIGIHTKPSNATKEISGLAQVYDWAAQNLRTTDAIIMGDFNAGCSYVKISDWQKIELWTRPDFTWLIGHETDTTAFHSSCPYDRFVTAGDKMGKAIIAGSARVYNYQEDFDLTVEQVRRISDHWPIELKVRGKVSPVAQKNLETRVCFSMKDGRAPTDTSFDEGAITKQGFKASQCDKCGDKGHSMRHYTKETTKLDPLLKSLDAVQAALPNILSEEFQGALRYKALSGALEDGSATGGKKGAKFRATLSCAMETLECSAHLCLDTTIN